MPRPARAVEAQQERRRRGDAIVLGTKLGVSPDFIDPNFSYRWLNDDGGRIEQMTTMDDYDLVPDPAKVGKSDADGLGSMVSKIVGKGEGGQAMRAYLARKPKKFYDEDQSRKANSIKQTMEAIRKGTPPVDGANALGTNGYVPGGSTGISIKDD